MQLSDRNGEAAGFQKGVGVAEVTAAQGAFCFGAEPEGAATGGTRAGAAPLFLNHPSARQHPAPAVLSLCPCWRRRPYLERALVQGTGLGPGAELRAARSGREAWG
jgi:hypothetical protein